jgi:hypothetical protein
MNKDPNQGEGDRTSGRRYGRDVQEFIAESKVDDAADVARNFVELHPLEAERAEQKAKRGPRPWATADELVAKGRTFVERIQRAWRARWTKK